ncbi:hypothetical protein [Kribbella shirazensis]|uniref:Uncharacterized protein n=1 Tax=Kribbella shirazensis TaxID=1105143 RepID=A0A7X5V6X8_9ACTN|nr:hypothetical protein [Kribbella shirazensis]NIK55722.1 hypothetical protein [Kribbella shirazensis]
MLIREGRGRLASMLADAGTTPGPATVDDVRTVVDVFRRFAAIPAEDAAPVEEDGDAVLAQFGTYDFRSTREFSADLTRQFLEAGDEDSPMWQLSCTFHWDPSPETERLAEGSLWSFGLTLDQFFAEAVALPGWAWALGSLKAPRDLAITLEEV